jgi:uncharacterized membrane protein YphA (DoxX/SURF4 family)
MSTSVTLAPHAKPQYAIGVPVALIRILLGGLFIFAGYLKVADPQAFAFSVMAFQIIPQQAGHLSHFIAFALPWTELLIGVLLVLGIWSRAAALLLAVLLVGFIGGIVSILARNMSISCGCFGDFEFPCKSPIGTCHIVRNSLLLLMALTIAAVGPGSLAVGKD